MMRAGLNLGRVLMCLAMPWCATAQDAAHWLERAQLAQAQRGYEGIVIYVHDGRVDQVRIVSRPGIDAFQRFASLSGNQRELLRSGGEVRALAASEAPTAWPAMALRSARVDLQRLARLYRMQVTGEDRVAGFAARTIEAAPQDGLRYGQRLWLDRDTGMLLGAALLGPDKQMLEQVMFAQLALEGGELASAAASPSHASEATISDSTTLLPGFVQIGGRIDAERQLEQRVFSDGLATISVYVERRNGAAAGEFSTRRGAVQLFGQQVGAYRVVAVGAVPPESTRQLVAATLASLVDKP